MSEGPADCPSRRGAIKTIAALFAGAKIFPASSQSHRCNSDDVRFRVAQEIAKLSHAKLAQMRLIEGEGKTLVKNPLFERYVQQAGIDDTVEVLEGFDEETLDMPLHQSVQRAVQIMQRHHTYCVTAIFNAYLRDEDGFLD